MRYLTILFAIDSLTSIKLLNDSTAEYRVELRTGNLIDVSEWGEKM